MTEDLIAELVSDRHRSPQQWEILFASSWPPYIDADPVATEALPDVRAVFSHLQVALTRLASPYLEERLVGAAWGVPICWGGDTENLPTGYSGALVRSLAERARRTAAHLLEHLIRTAADHGLHRVVAPLRLTGKHRYLLTPIDTYARWRRPDGEAFDPWLRTHERMGGPRPGDHSRFSVVPRLR